ncbi:PH domain-containing protein [Corynebacterium lactis]|uniref:Membrane protein n=1 Tax=Corynebacterium lactis RW2-5 TaxID=1408189 RepID=A0A0K2H001_9CORY|nr:PH domain-containing protein [Corynebacterium lactis]ALA67372.1 membrane protein [Corynebacterium lactis RW2-5]
MSDSAGGGQWLQIITSKTLTIWAAVAAAVVFAIHLFMGIVVDFGDTGASVTLIDRLAFPVLGAIIAAVFLLLTRARVRVSERGVEVRNLLTAKFYPWSDIYGLSFPKKAKWARLELPDFEFVPMLAVQSADGARVVEAVRKFRELEDKFMPED